jgi:hypothetical protein
LHEAHTTIILFDFAFPICQRSITNITIDTCWCVGLEPIDLPEQITPLIS